MARKHRLLTILLALALLLGAAPLPGVAEAAEPKGPPLSTKAKANALYELGLMAGTSFGEDGTPEFSLDRQLSRSEGAFMIAQLLGKRDTAQAQYAAGEISSPFTDLESWAAAEVTWMYANNMVRGTSPTTYAGKHLMDAMQFATLVLYTLGYSNQDFHYTQALPFAVQKQLITEEQSAAFQADFRRDGLVEMCYTALDLKMNGSELTLREKLVNEGVINNTAEPKPINLTVKYTGGGDYNPAYMEEQCLGNAVIDDLDGDGALEIVFGVRSILCANAADGKLKWRIDAGETGGLAENGRTPFQILDWDGDGEKEIFAMTFADPKGTVNIIDTKGNIKSSWTINEGNYNRNIWAGCPADLDGDGKYELIVGIGVGADGMSGVPAVYVYNYDGTIRSGWPQAQRYGLFSNSITAVDLDGDNIKEIVLTYDETQIVAFHADGTKVYAEPFGTTWDMISFFEGGDKTGNYDFTISGFRYGIMGTKSGIIADDLDGDGINEIIGVAMIDDIKITADRMASGTNNSFSGSAQYFAPYILNLDRTRYKNAAMGYDWSQIPTDTGTILALGKEDPNNPSTKINIVDPDYRPLTADLDGDNIKEILYTANDGLVHCFSLDGTEHGSWPFNLNSGASSVVSFASRPTAADLNGDGNMEVIFTTYTPHGQTSERGKLYVLDYTGKKLAEVTLPPKFYTNEDVNYANGCRTSPVVADIDNDGQLEIVVATYNCGLVAYELS